MVPRLTPLKSFSELCCRPNFFHRFSSQNPVVSLAIPGYGNMDGSLMLKITGNNTYINLWGKRAAIFSMEPSVSVLEDDSGLGLQLSINNLHSPGTADHNSS
jgi:hypothetical protein